MANGVKANGSKNENNYFKVKAIIILCTCIALGAIYFVFNPNDSSLFPQCPFHTLTGFDCPGCGSQRAVHHLLHFELKEALISNFLFVISLPYLALGIYLEYFGGKEKHPSIQRNLYGKKAIYTALFTIILFWIGRNVVNFWI